MTPSCFQTDQCVVLLTPLGGRKNCPDARTPGSKFSRETYEVSREVKESGGQKTTALLHFERPKLFCYVVHGKSSPAESGGTLSPVNVQVLVSVNETGVISFAITFCRLSSIVEAHSQVRFASFVR